MATMCLLWSWRRVGGVGRLTVAAALPVSWLALLPVVIPEVSSGPLAAFSRVAVYGMFWLGVGALADAFLPGRRCGLLAASRASAHGFPVMAAGVPAALAGLCLVGTTPFGPASTRSIRVHNYGGLDWELPVFGRFGSFSAGMFGLLPIYCRADGHDFDVIDHIETSGPAETTCSLHSPSAAPPPELDPPFPFMIGYFHCLSVMLDEQESRAAAAPRGNAKALLFQLRLQVVERCGRHLVHVVTGVSTRSVAGAARRAALARSR